MLLRGKRMHRTGIMGRVAGGGRVNVERQLQQIRLNPSDLHSKNSFSSPGNREQAAARASGQPRAASSAFLIDTGAIEDRVCNSAKESVRA